MAQTDDHTVVCRDGCKRTVADDDAASQAGWLYLSISKSWRCPQCWRELRDAKDITGQGQPTEDTLAPTSRGALPKETASTIVAPTVPRQRD